MGIKSLQEGYIGEEEVAEYLENNGYKIITRNFRCKLGEIDIIATDKDYICFIEVKKRNSADFGSPLEAITPSKIRKLTMTAQIYIKLNNLYDKNVRFDVVGVLGDKIELIKNAF